MFVVSNLIHFLLLSRAVPEIGIWQFCQYSNNEKLKNNINNVIINSHHLSDTNGSIKCPKINTNLRTALFCVITQRVVISYEASGQLIGPILGVQEFCPETSVRNCHYSLRNNTEERSSQLLSGGSLKSQIQVYLYIIISYDRRCFVWV